MRRHGSLWNGRATSATPQVTVRVIASNFRPLRTFRCLSASLTLRNPAMVGFLSAGRKRSAARSSYPHIERASKRYPQISY
jgi:hypothetical protein